MGGGSWTSSNFASYSTSRGRSVNSCGVVTTAYKNAQDMFTSRMLLEKLNPYNVIRECCDSEEHPNTIPVILALDVTGSMGDASMRVAKSLNQIMTKLYEKVTDVEFMIMAIGDLVYDSAPIQASQFESDIRIAEQLDEVYFEGGGGGNGYESYTAAWQFGLRHTKLDCWNRGKKGIIITLGDEPLNPYLPRNELNRALGCKCQANIETADLYKEVTEKFDVYHIAINDSSTSYRYYEDDIKKSWSKYLDDKHLLVSDLNALPQTISNIIIDGTTNNTTSDKISW